MKESSKEDKVSLPHFIFDKELTTPEEIFKSLREQGRLYETYSYPLPFIDYRSHINWIEERSNKSSTNKS